MFCTYGQTRTRGTSSPSRMVASPTSTLVRLDKCHRGLGQAGMGGGDGEREEEEKKMMIMMMMMMMKNMMKMMMMMRIIIAV